MTDPVSAGGTVGGGMLRSASNTPKMPETPLETSSPFCAACVTLGGCAKIFSGSSDAPTFRPPCGQLELEWLADLHFQASFLRARPRADDKNFSFHSISIPTFYCTTHRFFTQRK